MLTDVVNEGELFYTIYTEPMSQIMKEYSHEKKKDKMRHGHIAYPKH